MVPKHQPEPNDNLTSLPSAPARREGPRLRLALLHRAEVQAARWRHLWPLWRHWKRHNLAVEKKTPKKVNVI